MPSPFDGKWRLESMENGSAFWDAINSPDEYKTKLRQLAEAIKKDPNTYIEELQVDGDTLKRSAYVNGELKRKIDDAHLGAEVAHKLDDGRPAKVKLVKAADNKIVRTQVTDSFTITTTFEAKGDELIVTQTTGSVTLTEKFKKV
jgi:predicted transcriptional regulator